MTHHAYIDESGTMDHQGVMSVAMIVLEGKNSAPRLHDQVMTLLNPKHLELVKRLKKERRAPTFMPKMHFADMSADQKRIVGKRLAQAEIRVFTASCWHQIVPKSHLERFGIYMVLVKTCIRKALEVDRKLVVGVAKQGGWQEYEQRFCAELRELPREFLIQTGNYREVDIELISAVRPGVQLADFYAGAVREFTMKEDSATVFDLIRQQVITHEILELGHSK